MCGKQTQTTKNGAGKTLLTLAAEKGDLALLSWLLNKSADPNQADSEGNTALHTLARVKPGSSTATVLECAKLLVSAGASLGAINSDNRTPFAEAEAFSHAELCSFLRVYLCSESFRLQNTPKIPGVRAR